MYTKAERAIDELSLRQHGVFLRRQALAAGLTRRELDARVASGLYGTLAPGLHHPAAYPLTTKSLLMGACLLDPSVVASHESAAELHDFSPVVARGRVVVKGPIRRRSGHPLAQVHRSKLVMPDHRTEVEGIACTSVMATAGDLSAVLRPGRYLSMVDNLLSRKMIDTDQLGAHAVRWCRRGRKGSTLLWRTAEARGAGYHAPDSVLEELGLGVLAAGGLPDPVRQMQLPWRDDLPGRVDLAFPQYKVIVELDSWRYHGPDAHETDRIRDIEATAVGWRTIRITWKMLTEAPEWVCDRLRKILNCGV